MARSSGERRRSSTSWSSGPAVKPVHCRAVSGSSSAKSRPRDAPASKRLCYVGTNNYKAGVQAGELIKEVLPGGGKIMLFVGRIDAQNALERSNGIKDTLVDPLSDRFALIAAPNTIQFPALIAVLLASCVAVSALGSGLTLRRFLRV